MAQWWGTELAFQLLVAIGALFTAGCWLLIPLLKQAFPSPTKTAFKQQAIGQF